jgi:hypothetical protein
MSEEMNLVTVSLNVPKEVAAAMESISRIAVVPLDHVVAVVMAIHIHNDHTRDNGNVPEAKP